MIAWYCDSVLSFLGDFFFLSQAISQAKAPTEAVNVGTLGEKLWKRLESCLPGAKKFPNHQHKNKTYLKLKRAMSGR